jgi:hypothetical protein
MKLVDPRSRQTGRAANVALPVAMQTFVKRLQSVEIYCLHSEICFCFQYTRDNEKMYMMYDLVSKEPTL